jgi:hypothetical protein
LNDLGFAKAIHSRPLRVPGPYLGLALDVPERLTDASKP